ncbi:Blp family class II bacteriocin [Streptococcus danieliae]|uniref:Blp family class II bacteriocin n=1 Tax=Streptococcus danieliae TaxID=747656 RepID=UPI0021C9B76E|nr:Blp family class II bacteriocin [Streptococcus danieliae]MCU0082906.1 Blp family class II bacteriocin [Streptococcus danieliae]
MMIDLPLLNFEDLDQNELLRIEGGVSCFEGVVGFGSLGASFGPWGMVGGGLIGAAAYCVN